MTTAGRPNATSMSRGGSRTLDPPTRSRTRDDLARTPRPAHPRRANWPAVRTLGATMGSDVAPRDQRLRSARKAAYQGRATAGRRRTSATLRLACTLGVLPSRCGDRCCELRVSRRERNGKRDQVVHRAHVRWRSLGRPRVRHEERRAAVREPRARARLRRKPSSASCARRRHFCSYPRRALSTKPPTHSRRSRDRRERSIRSPMSRPRGRTSSTPPTTSGHAYYLDVSTPAWKRAS